jgi:hypothetical protein
MTTVVPIRPFNGPLAQSPDQMGEELAMRLQGVNLRSFLAQMDDALEVMRDELLAARRPPALVSLICREVRAEATAAWQSRSTHSATAAVIDYAAARAVWNEVCARLQGRG